MKLILFLAIFLATFLATQAYRYELALETREYQKPSVFKGELRVEIVNGEKKNTFFVDEKEFGTHKIIKKQFDSDFSFKRVVIYFNALYNVKDKILISDMVIKNLDLGTTQIFKPTRNLIEDKTFAIFFSFEEY